MTPTFAVISQNVPAGLGLKTLLQGLFPMAEVTAFTSFESFEESGPGRYVHFFADMTVFLHNRAFFEAHRHKTILLGHGVADSFPDMHQIDIYTSEEQLMSDILKLRHSAHRPEHHLPHTVRPNTSTLSSREAEVLTLIARGLMNKEIAEELHIGMTTVITHRRNIMEKLGIKSVAGLTLYAAALGYVDTDTL